MIKDSTCSDKEYAEALLLGEWITAECEGVERTVSLYNGRIYFLHDRNLGSMEFSEKNKEIF
jgi:hypothetical protein